MLSALRTHSPRKRAMISRISRDRSSIITWRPKGTIGPRTMRRSQQSILWSMAIFRRERTQLPGRHQQTLFNEATALYNLYDSGEAEIVVPGAIAHGTLQEQEVDPGLLRIWPS